MCPPDIRNAVVADPSLAVTGAPPVCIDEYQRAPGVLDAIKARLNKEGSVPGAAVLTGSTQHDAIPRTAQALTGRLHVLTLLPLSQGEMAGVAENLLPALLADPATAVAALPTSATTRERYVDLTDQ
ncbi:MAG: AAA family ATPase [Acidimicrobiales bacterium]